MAEVKEFDGRIHNGEIFVRDLPAEVRMPA